MKGESMAMTASPEPGVGKAAMTKADMTKAAITKAPMSARRPFRDAASWPLVKAFILACLVLFVALLAGMAFLLRS